MRLDASTILTLPDRLQRFLAAQLHAFKHYSNPTDADLARDLKVSVRTVKRWRDELAARNIETDRLCAGGNPHNRQSAAA